jgi:undecaprenyl-diphosphatase
MKTTQKLSMTIIILAILGFSSLTFGVVTNASWISAIDNVGRGVIRANITTDKTAFFTAVTYLAQPITAIILMLVTMAIAAIKKRYWTVLFVATNVIGGAALMAIIKRIVQRPRPVDKLIPESGFSFPSGHSVNAMVFYGSLLVLTVLFMKNKIWLRNIIALLLAITILAIPISRVYLGVHYPTDVLAGLLLGLIVLTTTTTFILPKEYNARP